MSDRQREVENLLDTYANLLDEDQLEDWLELFAEGARYEIVSRENVQQGLPLPLMLCENKNQIRDRVMSLRKANVFNIHADRHILSLVRVDEDGDGGLVAGCNFALYQTDQDGVSRLFSVGRYRHRLAAGPAGLCIAGTRVVVDMGSVPSLLATPM